MAPEGLVPRIDLGATISGVLGYRDYAGFQRYLRGAAVDRIAQIVSPSSGCQFSAYAGGYTMHATKKVAPN